MPFIARMLSLFEREETYPGKGAITFFIGVLLSLKLFPFDIAMASILILTFGDSVSHIIGRYWGKTRNPLSKTKLLEGTLAGTLAAFLAALLYVPWTEALVASILALMVEAIEIKVNEKLVDDNISVPLVAGTVIYVMRLLL